MGCLVNNQGDFVAFQGGFFIRLCHAPSRSLVPSNRIIPCSAVPHSSPSHTFPLFISRTRESHDRGAHLPLPPPAPLQLGLSGHTLGVPTPYPSVPTRIRVGLGVLHEDRPRSMVAVQGSRSHHGTVKCALHMGRRNGRAPPMDGSHEIPVSTVCSNTSIRPPSQIASGIPTTSRLAVAVIQTDAHSVLLIPHPGGKVSNPGRAVIPPYSGVANLWFASQRVGSSIRFQLSRGSAADSFMSRRDNCARS